MSDLKIPNKGGEDEEVIDILLPVNWYLFENYPIAFILLLFWLRRIPNFLLVFTLYFSFYLKS